MYHKEFSASWKGPFDHQIWLTITIGNDQTAMLVTSHHEWHDATCNVDYVGSDLAAGWAQVYACLLGINHDETGKFYPEAVSAYKKLKADILAEMDQEEASERFDWSDEQFPTEV